MKSVVKEKVISVHHWNDTLFSFKTTRSPGFRFKNGHFTMIGLEIDEKPLLRAYSIASANYEDHLEFFSIKVPNGPLTSKLQNIKIGDTVLVNSKTIGTLIDDNLLSGSRLILLSTGTGLAPFLSIIKDPEIYDQYDEVILTHGVRYVSELAYAQQIKEELPNNQYIGDIVSEKLHYYPTVTREEFKNRGRLTDLLISGELMNRMGKSPINIETDRFMLCGSPGMLNDLTHILKGMGFKEYDKGIQGHYVIEKAFVEKKH